MYIRMRNPYYLMAWWK